MRHAAAVALGLCLCSSTALANGRFPLSNQVAKTSALPQSLLVRASFGLLISSDGGKTFSWICEAAPGYGGTQDPGIALFADGSIAVAAFEGMSVSHDGGCTWHAIKDDGIADQYVIDVATERDAPERGVAITSTGLGPTEFYVQTFETLDSGRTWKKTGAQLPTDLLSETIDVAPSNPKRLYVSGVIGQEQDRKGVLSVSDDRGATWVRKLIPLEGDQAVYIAGVDPLDDKRVYIRTRGVADRLLVSDDAGKTLREIGRTTGAMTGFGVEPNGARVAFGGPMAGLFLGPRDAMTIPKIGPQTSVCLYWASEGLYACGADSDDGYIVGRSDDGAETFVPVLPTLSAIKGPLTTCAPGGEYEQKCAPVWPALAALFGTGNAGSGGTAGAAGASGGSTTPAQTPSSSSDDGCGCRVVGGRAGGVPLVLLAGAAAWGLVGARRRRR